MSSVIIVGGLVAINDIHSPEVQEIGRIAVKEHNQKTGDNLVFKRVINGLRQILRETLYVVVVEATNVDGIDWTYETKVIQTPFRPWPRFSVDYFKPVLDYFKE